MAVAKKTSTTATKKPARKRAPRKPKEPAFSPIAPEQVTKTKILSDENQVYFHTLFMGLTPEQKQGATMVLNAVAGAPILNEGYRKFFSFWRAYGPNAAQDLNINF